MYVRSAVFREEYETLFAAPWLNRRGTKNHELLTGDVGYPDEFPAKYTFPVFLYTYLTIH